MQVLIKRKTTIQSILIAVALVCFGLLPTAYAVRPSPTPSPTPPGENLGNGNSAAENVQALISLTTGVNNTATGSQALFGNTDGVENTATGYAALFSNTSGSFNNAIGGEALFFEFDWRVQQCGRRWCAPF